MLSFVPLPAGRLIASSGQGYEAHAPSDPLPRAALAAGGRRTPQFRSLVLAALAAVCEVGHPASAAARAAGLAAASAYMHSLANVRQTKHILEPVVYAALALELEQAGDPGIGDAEVRRGIECVSPEVCDVLGQVPARQPGISRLNVGLRARAFPQEG